ncbi:MAG: 3-oxoacyl-ACP reductase FabG, partial [Intestinibacter sp.]
IKQAKKEFGQVDILIKNAGITKDNLIIRMKESEFDQVIKINLKGAFNCLKAVTPIMLKQRSGKIVNMSSVVGVIGNPGQVNYCASKAGLIGMTKSLAREIGVRGINVNAIAPGFIDTDMTRVLTEEQKKNILSQIPLNKFGNIEDIANTALFLASENSNYITGQVIHIDGGMAM